MSDRCRAESARFPNFPEEINDSVFASAPFPSMWNYARSFLRRDNFKTVVILLYAAIALTIWKYAPAAPHYADSSTGRVLISESVVGARVDAPSLVVPSSTVDFTLQFLWNMRKIWCAFFLMGVFPALIVKFVFREKLSDYGLSFGSTRRSISIFLMFLPVFAVMGWLSGSERSFYDVYPFNPLACASPSALVAHSIAYFFLYYLAWEFMFRGFLQLGLANKFGAVPAVLVQTLASTMLHYGHPASETFGCLTGGLLWGFVVYRTRSIFSGWWQHAVLGITLDWSLAYGAC